MDAQEEFDKLGAFGKLWVATFGRRVALDETHVLFWCDIHDRLCVGVLSGYGHMGEQAAYIDCTTTS